MDLTIKHNGNGTVETEEIKTGTIGQGLVDSSVEGIQTNGQNIVKARWNHDLVESDGSHGIHNPDFMLEILNKSIAALR